VTLRPVGHSTGLVFVSRSDVFEGEVSFTVDDDGVHEVGGWGYAGPAPEIFVNPPADQKALHNVVVETEHEDGDEAGSLGVRRGIAELVAGHLERYAECRCWTVGVGRHLADWIAAGCNVAEDEPDEDEGEGEGEEPTPEPVPEPKPAAEAEPSEVVAAAKARVAQKTGAAKKASSRPGRSGGSRSASR
jgi:hypothetical protein